MSPLFGSKSSLFDTVTQYFKDDDWKFRQMEGKTILSMGFKGDSGTWKCFARVIEDQQRFLFYSMLETNAPADKRQAIAEFITRANYGLRSGNFEMDFSDGEIRYKTFIDIEGGELTATMWKNIVYSNVATMNRYVSGIMSVVYAGTSPEAAMTQIEG